MRSRLGVHTGARVAHSERDVVSDGSFGVLIDLPAIEPAIPGLDDHTAAERHGVACIQRQIQNDLIQLPGIHLHVPRLFGLPGYDLDVGRNQPSQHLDQIGHGGIYVQHFGLQHLLAAEGQHLPCEHGGARARFTDILNVPAPAVSRIEVGDRQVAVAQDDGEQIIEIVRHPARQAPYRLQLLRLAEIGFQALALGHVTHDG